MMRSSNRSRSILVSLLVAVMFLLPAIAGAEDVDQNNFNVSISVGYVMVPFVVTAPDGRPVRNVHSRQVELRVDGKLVHTDMFERTDDAPVSFTILLDTSGSMGLAGKLEGAKAAVRTLIKRQVLGDEYSLWTFDSKNVTQLVPFTRSGTRIIHAIDGVKPWGKTAFFDAVAKMPDYSTLGTNGSRAIILLTDGLDNASRLSAAELAARLEGVDVPIYPLGLRFPEREARETEHAAEAQTDLAVLQRVASISGGRVAIAEDPARLESAVHLIERDLRSQYLIGFTPTGQGTVKYRRISLYAGQGRLVRVRAGYRGTAPPLREADQRSSARNSQNVKKGSFE
ncbi:MAG: VWA domain-containing protein [Thermoanaerobaculia bacterium]